MSLSCTVSEIQQYIGQKSLILTYPTCIWLPRWGSTHWSFAEIFVSKKHSPYANLRCCFDDPTFSRFGRTSADRQTDRQTDRQSHSIHALVHAKTQIPHRHISEISVIYKDLDNKRFVATRYTQVTLCYPAPPVKNGRTSLKESLLSLTSAK